MKDPDLLEIVYFRGDHEEQDDSGFGGDRKVNSESMVKVSSDEDVERVEPKAEKTDAGGA